MPTLANAGYQMLTLPTLASARALTQTQTHFGRYQHLKIIDHNYINVFKEKYTFILHLSMNDVFLIDLSK